MPDTSTILKILVIGLLILLLIYLVNELYKRIKIEGEDYHQRLTRINFNNLHGENYDEATRQTIANGLAIRNPRAIDNFRIGTAYLVNAGNPQEAYNHFQNALRQIIHGNVNIGEADFILDRIDDNKIFFMDFPEIVELPLEQAFFANFDQKRTMIDEIKKKKQQIKKDDPAFAQKMLIAQKYWQSDSQNVHDSSIFGELEEQLILVIKENAKIHGLEEYDYYSIREYLNKKYTKDKDKLEKIEKVLNFLDNNYVLPTKEKFHEQDIITAVWRRSHDPDNIKNKEN